MPLPCTTPETKMQRQKVTNLLLFDKCAQKRNFVSMQAKYHVYHNYIIERIVCHVIQHRTPSENQCKQPKPGV